MKERVSFINRRIRKKWRQHKPLTMSYSERRKQMRIFQVLVINLKHASNHINPKFLLVNQHNPFKSYYDKWGIDVHDMPILLDADVINVR